MAFNRFYVISPLALVAVSACRSPYSAQNAVGGAVVKGPLSNALVFLDYNDDGVLDANEPFARTDSFGQYELTATQSEYTLVAMADDQTVDTSSGAALSGVTLTAPSGAGVITPTTTLMEEGGISAEDVAAVLGLPDGIDPLTFNPFDVDENDAAAVAAALEVEKVSQQIMTAVTSFASAAEGAGAGAGDAFTAALGSVVDVVKTKAEKIDDPNAAAADKAIDFTNAADLALIKTEATSKAAALDGIDAATMNALADDTTAAIKNVNDKIATVTDLDADATKNIFSTMQVLQDQVKEAAETQKAGGVANISFKDSAAVDTAALNSAPEAITLSGDRLVSADGELVVGTVATIDPDPNDTTFTYTLLGPDAVFFDFNSSSGELSLKSAPNYADKPYYEITIQSKDPGGKPYSETFKIDVVPEFGALGDPDPTVASDFDMIMKQNPLFMRMNSEVQLKQTPDGQLVLVELMSSDGGGYGSPSDSNSGSSSDGPIMAFINVTDRGYELLNPATNDYMGGFFTYEEGGLTYTGYEVFVDDMSVLAKYEEDLIKYFAPDSTYGSGALKYTERDIEFVSLVGAKAVNKDGHAVQEMLGFSHYDKDMNILGSAGIDVADPSKPVYIEVVGEYDPAVSTNIISTLMSDASVGLEMQTLLQTAGEAILYGDDHDHGATAVNGGGISTAGGAPTEIIEVQAGSFVKFKYEVAERGSVLQQAEFVFLDDNGGRIPVRDFDNDGIASFKTSSNLMNGVYTLNQVILSDFNDISNSANYFANEITAFGPPGSTPPQGTNLGLIIKNEFSYSNHNFDLGKYAIKVVGGKEARTDFTAPELISVTIDNPAITPGQQVSIKYNVNDDSPLNNVSFRFANDAGEHIILSDFDNDGVATTDVDALRMNGSYTLQEASFRDVAGNYSGYKAVGGHSGPPPPPGVPINNDPNLNLETSTGWPNKEFLSHNFDFSQFTLEMSGGIAVQTDFTHPELAALEKVVTVNQGAVGTINYTPSEVLGYASFTFKNDAGKQLHFEDRENDGIARVSAIQTSTTGTYELSQIYMRDLNKIPNNSSYLEGNELHLRTSDFQEETTHDLDFSQYTVNVVEWGGISETDMPTFASAAMENAVISWREFGEINYVADGTGSSLESVEFHFTSPSGERVSFWDYDDDGVATALLSNYSLKNETFSLERVQLRDEGGNTLQLMDGNQPDLEFTVTGANPVSADTNVPTFASATLENTVANNGEYFNINYVADGTGSRLKNVEFVFKDASQTQLYLRDQDDDGIATSLITGNDLYDGTFTLDRINLLDEGGNRSNITGNDLPDLEFTLTGAKIRASTETTMPTFTSAALEKTDFNKGEYININYVADGTGSPIKQVLFQLSHLETGHQFDVSDNDNDGVATALLSSDNLSEGTYNVSLISVEDEANNITRVNNLPNLEFNVAIPASLSDPQTDFEPPELIEINFTEDII